MTRRWIVGGVDVTDHIIRVVDEAPQLTHAQADQLRLIWAGAVAPKRSGSTARTRSSKVDTGAPEAA